MSITVRVQEDQNTSQKPGGESANGVFIRRIWFAGSAEQAGSNQIGWSGSHQLSVSLGLSDFLGLRNSVV